MTDARALARRFSTRLAAREMMTMATVQTIFEFVHDNKTNSTFEEPNDVVGIPSKPGQIYPRHWVLDELATDGVRPTKIRMTLEAIK